MNNYPQLSLSEVRKNIYFAINNNDLSHLQECLMYVIDNDSSMFAARYEDAIEQTMRGGSVEFCQYLLNLESFKSILLMPGEMLGLAAYHNNLPVLRYLLLEKKYSIHEGFEFYIEDIALVKACEAGNIPLIDYLLSSPELTEHANMYANYHHPFAAALNNNHVDVAEHLIMRYNLQYNQDIDYFFKNGTPNPVEQYVRRLFEKAQLQKDLENNLPISAPPSPKLKI